MRSRRGDWQQQHGTYCRKYLPAQLAAVWQFYQSARRETIYGVVFNAYTHSLEPNRLAIAYHRSEQELRDEQPQIFELLKTKFEAVIIGYETEALSDSTCHQPPRLHSFVHICQPMEVRQLTSHFWFFLLSHERRKSPAGRVDRSYHPLCIRGASR